MTLFCPQESHSGGEPIGFWETDKSRIEHDDLLLIIEPTV